MLALFLKVLSLKCEDVQVVEELSGQKIGKSLKVTSMKLANFKSYW